jgi:hypothetical protein
MDPTLDADCGEGVALEVQAPFAELLVSGTKIIDVRTYALSERMLNRPVYIIETTGGVPGKSVLGDTVDKYKLPEGASAKAVGWVVFSACDAYTSAEAFKSDESKHLVESDSVYAFGKGAPGTEFFAWRVARCGRGCALLLSHRSLYRSVYAVRVERETGFDLPNDVRRGFE